MAVEIRLRGVIDVETYELLAAQALRRGMNVPQFMSYAVRTFVRLPEAADPAGVTSEARPATVAGNKRTPALPLFGDRGEAGVEARTEDESTW